MIHPPPRASQVENDPETSEVLYEKNLVYYELDLGLNHVVRKWADPVDPTANMLVMVPGGNDGPGGVLVCSENFMVYKNQGHPDRRCALPRRRDLPNEHGLLCVASAVHRQRDLFFIIVQSEMGDLYKVTFTHAEEQVPIVVVGVVVWLLLSAWRACARRLPLFTKHLLLSWLTLLPPRRCLNSRCATSTRSQPAPRCASSSPDSCTAPPSLVITRCTSSRGLAMTTTRRCEFR